MSTSLIWTPPEVVDPCEECWGDGAVEYYTPDGGTDWDTCPDCGGSGLAVPPTIGVVWVWLRRIARVVRVLSWFTGWGPTGGRHG